MHLKETQASLDGNMGSQNAAFFIWIAFEKGINLFWT